MYKVIKFFTDLQDNKHPYHEGDTFPREGVTVTEERLKELASKKNKRGVALIKEVKEEVKEEAIPFAEGEPYEAEKHVEAEKKPRAKSKKKG